MDEQRMPVSAIEPPAVIIDMDVLESNIAQMSRLAREVGVRLRPHTKIHECPGIAKLQMAAGACGIEVGAIERALCMADPEAGSTYLNRGILRIFIFCILGGRRPLLPTEPS